MTVTVPEPWKIPRGTLKFPGDKCIIPGLFSERSAAVSALAKIVDAVAENLENLLIELNV